MSGTKEIPLYTKIGVRVTMILLLFLGAMLIKNCVGSFFYASTDEVTLDQYYQQGFQAGRKKAAEGLQEIELEFASPLHKKYFHKGYRAGWDTAKGEDRHNEQDNRE